MGESKNESENKNNGWKKIYADYLKTINMEEYPKGKFIYVDEDNIPELYLEGYCAAAGHVC